MSEYEQHESAPVIRIACMIIEQAIERGASELLIEPRFSGSMDPMAMRPEERQRAESLQACGMWPEAGVPMLRVAERISGDWLESMPMPDYMREPLTKRFKLMANLDLAVTDRSQQGHAPVRFADRSYLLMLTTTPSDLGEVVHMRVES